MKVYNFNFYQILFIGSGSAGAVVAARLSEVENWNVLLLEAGGDETEISDVPLMAGYLQLSKLDWQYKSEPSGKFCLGKSDKQLQKGGRSLHEQFMIMKTDFFLTFYITFIIGYSHEKWTM